MTTYDDQPPSAEVAPRPAGKAPIADMLGQIRDFDQAWRIATMLAGSDIVPVALRGKPANVMIVMAAGQELGLSWSQSMRHLFVAPGGNVGLKGELLLVKIRQAGHDYDFRSDDEEAEFRLHRGHQGPAQGFGHPCDGKDYEADFTLARAAAAGLCTVLEDGTVRARSQYDKPLPWETYTKDMILWRAVARACRFGCPEVVFGFTLEGEPADDSDGPAPPLRPAGPATPQPGQPVPETDLDAARSELADLAAHTGGPPADDDVVDAELVEDEQQPPPQPEPQQRRPRRSRRPAEATEATSEAAEATAATLFDPDATPNQIRGLRARMTHFGLDTDEDHAFAASVILRRWLPAHLRGDLTQSETAAILAVLDGIAGQATEDRPAPALASELLGQMRDDWRAADPGSYGQDQTGDER